MGLLGQILCLHDHGAITEHIAHPFWKLEGKSKMYTFFNKRKMQGVVFISKIAHSASCKIHGGFLFWTIGIWIISFVFHYWWVLNVTEIMESLSQTWMLHRIEQEYSFLNNQSSITEYCVEINSGNPHCTLVYDYLLSIKNEYFVKLTYCPLEDLCQNI